MPCIWVFNASYVSDVLTVYPEMREFPHPGHYARTQPSFATVTGRGEEHFQGHERLRNECIYNMSYKKTLETYAARGTPLEEIHLQGARYYNTWGGAHCCMTE